MCLLIMVLLFAFDNRIFAQHDANLTINIDINVNVENSEFQNNTVKIIGERQSVATSGRNFNRVSRIRND